MFADLVTFLSEHRRWWIVPTIAVAILSCVLIALEGTGPAPYIYLLF